MPRIGSKPSPTIQTLAQAVSGGAIGYAIGLLSNPFLPFGAAVTQIYQALPLLAAADVATVVSMAREQSAVAEQLNLTGGEVAGGLFAVPVQPGVRPNAIEVQLLVSIYDSLHTDAAGNPLVVTRGMVVCTSKWPLDLVAIQECVDSFAEQVISQHYPAVGAYQFDSVAVAARRGTFFGR